MTESLFPDEFEQKTGQISSQDKLLIVDAEDWNKIKRINKSQIPASDDVYTKDLVYTKTEVDSKLGTKQANLGFTPENTSNKSNDGTMGGDSPSNSLFTTQFSVVTYLNSIKAQLLGGAEGMMINGKIVTFISNNTLTVAIKTLAGNDPSISDPVRVRINNTVRVITSALSKNQGTAQSFNMGSAELAGKDVDLFVYLFWNEAAGSVGIAFSRISWAKTGADFNSSYGHEYGNAAWSTGGALWNAGANPTRKGVVVGRCSASMASGTYYWSIPATSVIENYPIFMSRLLFLNPQYPNSGSMTFTSVSTQFAQYQIIGKKTFCDYGFLGITGGTASTQILATGPFQIPVTCTGDCRVVDSPNQLGHYYGSGGNIAFLRSDAGNFGLGTSRGAFINFHFNN